MCADCGREYPMLNGVLRFVDAQNYAGSFGFQWKLYSRTQMDDAASQRSEQAFSGAPVSAPKIWPVSLFSMWVAVWDGLRKLPPAGAHTWWAST